nr:O-antigen ligase family protein [Cryobacterium roopkundense]
MLAGGLGGVLLIAYMLWALKRWPGLGFVLIGGAILVMKDTRGLPSLSAGGLTIGLFDIMSMVFAAAAVLNFVTARQHGKPRSRAWMRFAMGFILVAVVFALLRGAQEFGLAPAVNEARTWIYIAACGAWLVSVDPLSARFGRNMVLLSATVAVGLVVVAGYGIAVNGIGSSAEGTIDAAGNAISGRPINSGQALVLALSGFVLLAAAGKTGNRFYRVLAWASFFICVIVQHRSVWAAAGVGALAYFLMARRREKFHLVILGSCAALILAVLASFGTFDQILASIFTSAGDSRTYDARMQGWVALTQDAFRSFQTVLFGFPFGHGWERVQGSGYVNFSPHNWYLTVFLRTGLVGLGLFLAVMVAALGKSFKLRNDPPALAILVATLLYMWPYSLEWISMPFVIWAAYSALVPRTGETDGLITPDSARNLLNTARSGVA